MRVLCIVRRTSLAADAGLRHRRQNLAYLRVAARTREDLPGRNVFDAFQDNPADPSASGVRDLRESLRRVLASSEPDALPFMHYDVEVPGSPGVFARRYWCPVNAPVTGADGLIALIAECVEEISDKVQRFVGGLATDAMHQEPG